MGAPGRWFQLLCLLGFLALAGLPAHEPRLHPLALSRPGTLSRTPAWPAAGSDDVPAATLSRALRQDVVGGALGSALWRERRWYPFLLAPVWVVALLAVAGPGAAAQARRRAVGAALLGLSVALAVFEACYLGIEYAPLLPDLLGRAEVVLAWVVVVGLLFLRRRADRRIDAVEAHVAGQALLSVAHLLTLPSSQLRAWLSAFPLHRVLEALGENFRPAFWAATALLALSLAPVYLRRAPPPA